MIGTAIRSKRECLILYTSNCENLYTCRLRPNGGLLSVKSAKRSPAAARVYEPGKIVMEDVPIPELKKKDILIKVHRVGICGTDVGVVHGYVKTKLPVPLGHEFSGTIAEFGKNLRSDVRGKRWFQTAAGPSNESNRQMDFWKVMESGRDLLLAQKDVFVDSTARMFYTFAAEPDDPHRYNLGSVWMMMENIS